MFFELISLTFSFYVYANLYIDKPSKNKTSCISECCIRNTINIILFHNIIELSIPYNEVLQTFLAHAKPTPAIVKKHNIFYENNCPDRPVSIELAAGID